MTKTEETLSIISTYSSIFLNSDAHNWDELYQAFDDTVLLDYSSLSGQPAAIIKVEAIVKAWFAFLPKFKFTMHYLANHVVHVEDNKASASCYGHAIHHYPEAEGGDLWEVFGTYQFELQKPGEIWKVTSMKYNHKYASGNLSLPAIVSKL